MVANTVAPAEHYLVRLRLSDGRELAASPGHPVADGRRMGSMAAGDTGDGAQVVSIEKLAYDLLPDGGTGFYWAKGVLVGSTLHVAN